MLRSRRRAAKQLETVFEMWVFIDTSLSMKIPRFRTHLTSCTISQPTWRGMLRRRSCWRGDVHHNSCSDLAAFSCRRFTFIHSDVWATQVEMCCWRAETGASEECTSLFQQMNTTFRWHNVCGLTGKEMQFCLSKQYLTISGMTNWNCNNIFGIRKLLSPGYRAAFVVWWQDYEVW